MLVVVRRLDLALESGVFERDVLDIGVQRPVDKIDPQLRERHHRQDHILLLKPDERPVFLE